MDDSYLVNLLKSKLAETEQEAAQAERLAADYQAKASHKRALAENIRATIKGLIVGSNLVSLEEKPPLVKESLVPYNKQETLNFASPFDNNKGGQLNQQPISETDSFRSPKTMQCSEYRGGYIQVAQKILEDYPEGLHIDELVRIIFDTRTPEEFEKAKASFIVELGRGVNEGRLGKSGAEIYLASPTRVISEPQFEDDFDEEE